MITAALLVLIVCACQHYRKEAADRFIRGQSMAFTKSIEASLERMARGTSTPARHRPQRAHESGAEPEAPPDGALGEIEL